METSTALALAQASYSYLKDLGGFLVNERDREKFFAIKFDLSNKLMELQAQILEVQGAVTRKDSLIRTLQERIAETESDQRERSRYQLAKVGTLGDFFTYKLRPASELFERVDEPEHFICQPCFDAGKKSVLRVTESSARCHLCKVSTTISRPEPIEAISNPWGY